MWLLNTFAGIAYKKTQYAASFIKIISIRNAWMNVMKRSLLKTYKASLLSVAVSAAFLSSNNVYAANAGDVADQAGNVKDFLTAGEVLADFRLRYEENSDEFISQRKNATALTLRSRIGYETASLAGFKLLLEGEDITAVVDDYSPENNDFDPVLDPEATEWNRVQLSYENQGFSAVLGRQRIELDNERFIGNNDWRQNERTFDAARVGYEIDGWNLQYIYIDQVNTQLSSELDADDHLFNISYSGLALGKVAAYAYSLNGEEEIDNSNSVYSSDTYGAYLDGKNDSDSMSFTYRFEYAVQTFEYNDRGDVDTDYVLAEAGLLFSGVTTKVGFEGTYGPDGFDQNNSVAFATPYGSNHEFNGWSDKLNYVGNDGLEDVYISVSGYAGPVKLIAVYHDYDYADDNTSLGRELNLMAEAQVNDNVTAGLKYAGFSTAEAYKIEGDPDVEDLNFEDASRDTNKFWLWVGVQF
ncbi:alginate export family protein [Bacterioplanoides sp. SCSIO 12839]|uniref:alginate export family protein n=1 Tax=Bacterioplanoides sp. SCSIO 12839 TaxID=2829569 RepID=UPI00210246C6|nr:alginate export family protein [Bacterioplanoides sp. SCSIO 12839]UTW49451.1 alginate export family protein [Bacterioplanoides sp. SCSIO 12839]